MRLRINIHSKDGLVLPINYQYILQSVIYNALSEDPQYSKLILNRTKSDKWRRLFSFSLLNGKYKIENRNIIFFKDIHFIVSAVDPYFIYLVHNAMNSKGIWFGKVRVDASCEVLSEPQILSNKIKIEMLSPIIAKFCNYETGKYYYFGPNEIAFTDLINSSYKRKYQIIMDKDPVIPIKIKPLGDFNKDKYVTRYKGIYMTGWKGKYEIEAETKGLEILYTTGLGTNNTRGFGLFNII